jgi:hypothetical protein
MILLILYYFITLSIAFGIDIGDSSISMKKVYSFRNICENIFFAWILLPAVLGMMIQEMYENLQTLKNQ